MSRSEGSGPAEQAAADVADLLSRATGLRRVVMLAAAEALTNTALTATLDHPGEPRPDA